MLKLLDERSKRQKKDIVNIGFLSQENCFKIISCYKGFIKLPSDQRKQFSRTWQVYGKITTDVRAWLGESLQWPTPSLPSTFCQFEAAFPVYEDNSSSFSPQLVLKERVNISFETIGEHYLTTFSEFSCWQFSEICFARKCNQCRNNILEFTKGKKGLKRCFNECQVKLVLWMKVNNTTAGIV